MSAKRKKIKVLQKWINFVNPDIEMFAAIALCVAVMIVGNIPCPILFFTGISCAGCGMSRAWLCLLRLDIKGAFHYHPLFWIPPVFCMLYLFRRKIPVRVFKTLCTLMIILFFAVYVLRMLSWSDDIVVFAPENGFIFRVISAMLGANKQQGII